MFKLFRKPGIGLDLSDRSFKIVQLKKSRNKVCLSSFLKADIPAGLVKGGEIQEPIKLAKIFRKVAAKVKGAPLEEDRVICNLPEEKVFIRVIQLPKMNQKEMNQAVRWEAAAHIPLSIKEAYLDWQIIEPSDKKIDHLDVLIAATPKALVQGYISFLEQAGLFPVALEPESVAAVRSLILPKEIIPTIIVDLGATGTNFVIFSASAIRFTSHIEISGQLFNQAIMDNLGVDQKEAEKIKYKFDLGKTTKTDKVYRAIEPILSELAKQIKDYIAFYHQNATHVHGPDGVIGQVILCGGDSLMCGLPTYLGLKMNLDVRLGNPLNNILLAKGVNLPKKQAPGYTIALGLALREFIH